MVTVVYDDDCGFCTWSADLLARRARPAVDLEFVPFSALEEREDLRGQLPGDWADCAHLVVDGEVHSCGAATEQALLLTEWAPDWAADLVAFLRNFDDYEGLREAAYELVADNRELLGELASRDSLDAEVAGGDEADVDETG